MGIVLPLFLLSISFNYVGNRNLVLGDESLIQLQCRNAEVPSTCIRCVESDPRGQSADKVTIAAIVISCISDSAETLSGNMSALIGPREDGGVKRALRNCVEGFSKAKADLTKATNMLENKDYDETNSLVNKALHQQIYCKQNLSEYHISYPSMDYDMTIYEELTDAAMRIVDRF